MATVTLIKSQLEALNALEQREKIMNEQERKRKQELEDIMKVW